VAVLQAPLERAPPWTSFRLHWRDVHSGRTQRAAVTDTRTGRTACSRCTTAAARHCGPASGQAAATPLTMAGAQTLQELSYPPCGLGKACNALVAEESISGLFWADSMINCGEWGKHLHLGCARKRWGYASDAVAQVSATAGAGAGRIWLPAVACAMEALMSSVMSQAAIRAWFRC
jgi:hypothetical protein